jgi:hypothetical protein
MKTGFACFTLLCIVIIGISSTTSAQDNFPSLIGKWTGPRIGHSLENGFVSSDSGLLIEITKQEGRLFTGKKTIRHIDIKKNNITSTEPISGMITTDGKTLYIADKANGVTIGNIIAEDNIEFYYIQSGRKEGQFVSYYNFRKLKK